MYLIRKSIRINYFNFNYIMPKQELLQIQIKGKNKYIYKYYIKRLIDNNKIYNDNEL